MGAITIVDFKRVGYLKIFRFSHATVLATANTGECILSLPKRGVVRWVKVYCPTSVDFDFTLFTKTGVIYPDKDVVLYTIDNNIKYESTSPLEIPYFNDDTVMTNKLYFYLVNTDGAHPTGVISIEIGIDERGFDR